MTTLLLINYVYCNASFSILLKVPDIGKFTRLEPTSNRAIAALFTLPLEVYRQMTVYS
ncbi:hypothetical protein GS601_05100 [Myxacorys almedinensis A]|uniref:Uncharacterized protein n=1 Tax=Myxacorys almedinensis A TaxID=2690445 RepID=A0A8J8CIL7_9CYAN|nr:hypothetical protein [Myxacorys almedinensis A]